MSTTDQVAFDAAYNEAMSNMYQGRPVANVEVYGGPGGTYLHITFADDALPTDITLTFDYNTAPGL